MSIQYRTIAIVLFILLVLETLFIGWLYVTGSAEIERENECINLYYEVPEAMSYEYNSLTQICYLYDRDNNVILQRIIQ